MNDDLRDRVAAALNSYVWRSGHDWAEAALHRVWELHRPHDCADHIRPSTPVPCVNAGVCRGCHAEHPCPTLRAIDTEEDG